MGLDNIWAKRDSWGNPIPADAVEHPTFDPELRLCGGMMSAHGSGSFRGKVYNDFIMRVSGLSLYGNTVECEVTEDEVERIATALATVDPNKYPDNEGAYGVPTKSEVTDLRRMFRAYADEGFYLVAWY